MKKTTVTYLVLLTVSLVALMLIQGCGGNHYQSVVSGTVSDMNQNILVDAEVFVDDNDTAQTRSLVSGAYRLENVTSGWHTIRATAVVNGQTWVGSTAVEVLKNEPTMNANIVLAPYADTTTIRGYVLDDTSHPVSGARVLVAIRPVQTDQPGPYGSIVAVTDEHGDYQLDDVPTGVRAIITASKVGFTNDEVPLDNILSSMPDINFHLQESPRLGIPGTPTLDGIESYTMPDTITRGDTAYNAIKAFTSERYRKSLGKRTTLVTRSTPTGSLIENDVYWTDPNPSDDIAGYGIYRGLSARNVRAIDFVRDPYAIFYGDTGIEITPGIRYYYGVTAVNVTFLDEWNRENPNAESYPPDEEDIVSVVPLGQIRAVSPRSEAEVSGTPVFSWQSLPGASKYTVYVYSKFPALPLDPGYDYGSDPAALQGALPVWPTTGDPGGSTVMGGSTTSIAYGGPALQSGRTYWWVVLATDASGTAFSYGDLRPFAVR